MNVLKRVRPEPESSGHGATEISGNYTQKTIPKEFDVVNQEAVILKGLYADYSLGVCRDAKNEIVNISMGNAECELRIRLDRNSLTDLSILLTSALRDQNKAIRKRGRA